MKEYKIECSENLRRRKSTKVMLYILKKIIIDCGKLILVTLKKIAFTNSSQQFMLSHIS